jgi:predicted adenylyl cyclase CyaB
MGLSTRGKKGYNFYYVRYAAEHLMYEVEIKILDIDRPETEKRLSALGAAKTFDDEIHAVYYDSPDYSIRNSRGTFRLRKEGPNAVLAFKRHVEHNEAKVREEREVVVSDFDAMRWILDSAGFTVWLEMRKMRTTYEFEGLHFEFDRYLGAYGYIPEFLEIEGPDVDAVYRYAGLLGFTKEDCKPWDAVQLAEYYSRQ